MLAAPIAVVELAAARALARFAWWQRLVVAAKVTAVRVRVFQLLPSFRLAYWPVVAIVFASWLNFPE